MEIGTDWTTVKAFYEARTTATLQYIATPDTYYIYSIDGQAEVYCQIPIVSPAPGGSDQADFETNYQSEANVSPNSYVTSLFEANTKDLKIACMAMQVGAGTGDTSTTATASIKIPGTFGSGTGRWIAGGYGISEDYDKDDRAILWVSDNDRYIAWAIALHINPAATSPIPDAEVIALGVLPAPFSQAFPLYPIIKNYYDDAAPSGNQGWYFWAEAKGDSLPPNGEVEMEPIAGYAFIPSGLYLNIKYIRATLTTGGIRVNLDWGITNLVGV